MDLFHTQHNTINIISKCLLTVVSFGLAAVKFLFESPSVAEILSFAYCECYPLLSILHLPRNQLFFSLANPTKDVVSDYAIHHHHYHPTTTTASWQLPHDNSLCCAHYTSQPTTACCSCSALHHHRHCHHYHYPPFHVDTHARRRRRRLW